MFESETLNQNRLLISSFFSFFSLFCAGGSRGVWKWRRIFDLFEIKWIEMHNIDLDSKCSRSRTKTLPSIDYDGMPERLYVRQGAVLSRTIEEKQSIKSTVVVDIVSHVNFHHHDDLNQTWDDDEEEEDEILHRLVLIGGWNGGGSHCYKRRWELVLLFSLLILCFRNRTEFSMSTVRIIHAVPNAEEVQDWNRDWWWRYTGPGGKIVWWRTVSKRMICFFFFFFHSETDHN